MLEFLLSIESHLSSLMNTRRVRFSFPKWPMSICFTSKCLMEIMKLDTQTNMLLALLLWWPFTLICIFTIPPVLWCLIYMIWYLCDIVVEGVMETSPFNNLVCHAADPTRFSQFSSIHNSILIIRCGSSNKCVIEQFVPYYLKFVMVLKNISFSIG